MISNLTEKRMFFVGAPPPTYNLGPTGYECGKKNSKDLSRGYNSI